jgi:hypothetical protein
MRLYKYLTLMFLLGMVSAAANATAIDPGVILHGDGASQLVGPIFGGGFQTTAVDPFQCATEVDGSPTGDESNTNCFQNNTVTFVALHLFFASPNPLLSFGCGDNSHDPFFGHCGVSDNEITFSGLGFVDSTNGCGEEGCPGIQNLDHFLIGLVNMDGSADITDTATYSAVAELPIGSTPEPASVLLFVIAIGAIALFLKRA